MSLEADEQDPLRRWLSGEGLAVLDAITREAVDIIAVMDRELLLRYINWTAAGLTREQIIGHSVLDLSPPGDRALVRERYLEVLRTGFAARFETIYRDENDVLIWDVRVGPVRFEGQVVGLIVITTDVTEQRRAGADRDRFFSLSLDMLVVITADRRLKRINPAFGETLLYGVSELLGRPFLELVHPDDRARTLEAFDFVLRGNSVSDFENRYQRKDGEYRVFSWRATVDPITGYVYAVARDITEHRATEAQLRHAQKMEAVGQLAGGIAHDFNNLLQVVLANGELAMLSSPLPSKIREHLVEIESAGRRAAELTKQLLTFSRRQPLRPVSVDLNDLTRGLMRMLRRLLPENIAIDLITAADLLWVSADPTQLEQVIINLCVNARDAMERGGSLTIQTENVLTELHGREGQPSSGPRRYVVLRVTDTGVGMSAEVRERAFEPFFTTKSVHKGTGLGLSIAYGIVQQHEGMIELKSALGEGTTLSMYLPAASRVEPLVRDESHAPSTGGGETILLAEDEERVRQPMVQILEAAGYRTIAAVNGKEAIDLLNACEGPVHLVLLDVVMPELGGPETWERIRTMRQGLRVLFTSGYADDRSLKRLPPDAEVVEKPFRAHELLTRVRRKLDED